MRIVGCFDVYRLEKDSTFDPSKKAYLSRFVWKYTAESQPGGRELRQLMTSVSSNAGTTYDWAPGASVPVDGPTMLTAAVSRDLLPVRVPGREAPGIASETDGWDYEPLPGWIDPHLTDNLHSVVWNAPKGKAPPAGVPASLAGASIWGLTEPAPDVMPTHLRVEAGYR